MFLFSEVTTKFREFGFPRNVAAWWQLNFVTEILFWNKKIKPEMKNKNLVWFKIQLKEIELKLKKLEDQTKDVHKKIQFLREREEQLRGTNRTIHDRVITYSICTVVILLCLAFIQILYLKNFFRAKKMI